MEQKAEDEERPADDRASAPATALTRATFYRSKLNYHVRVYPRKAIMLCQRSVVTGVSGYNSTRC